MEIQASRTAARVGPDGEPVPLLEQNRGRWDQLLIRRGYAALLRAERLGRPVGPYVLQAAIAACHARARTPEETDWAGIAALYEVLVRLTPTPVVELNRAVAVGMADGPAARPGDRRRASRTSRPCATTTCCRPCAATCWPGSAATTRRGPSSRRAAALTRNARERTVLAERADPA